MARISWRRYHQQIYHLFARQPPRSANAQGRMTGFSGENHSAKWLAHKSHEQTIIHTSHHTIYLLTKKISKCLSLNVPVRFKFWHVSPERMKFYTSYRLIWRKINLISRRISQVHFAELRFEFHSRVTALFITKLIFCACFPVFLITRALHGASHGLWCLWWRCRHAVLPVRGRFVLRLRCSGGGRRYDTQRPVRQR